VLSRPLDDFKVAGIKYKVVKEMFELSRSCKDAIETTDTHPVNLNATDQRDETANENYSSVKKSKSFFRKLCF